MPSETVDATLETRALQYGDFAELADLAQLLKSAVRKHKGWNAKSPMVQESIDMILHKICRILNGTDLQKDSWHDIAGYAKLVEMRLKP